jgi:hypothetical protein
VKTVVKLNAWMENDGRCVYHARLADHEQSLAGELAQTVRGNQEATEQLQEILTQVRLMCIRFRFQLQYFRHEGHRHDSLYALPDKREAHPIIRLYCLKLSESTLILGGGGYKPDGRPYQEHPVLNWHAELLQKLEAAIEIARCNGSIRFSSAGRLEGMFPLQFEIDHDQYPG